MTQLYIKYDIENETVIAGPQGVRPDESWVPFIPAKNLKMRQAVSLHWVEELGSVVQVARDEHVPNYAELRSDAYPQLAEQCDKLWHDIAAGTLDQNGDFYSALKAVKDAHPKPS